MNNTIDPEAYRQGKLDLLDYLIGIAQNTQGAEVWRALFAEILDSISNGISK